MSDETNNSDHEFDGDITEVQNELGDVRSCGCGGVNLAMGPLTLHFNSDEVDGLLELVGAAKDMVDARREQQKQTEGKKKKRPGKAKPQGMLH